jgi:hypothetical protein
MFRFVNSLGECFYSGDHGFYFRKGSGNVYECVVDEDNEYSYIETDKTSEVFKNRKVAALASDAYIYRHSVMLQVMKIAVGDYKRALFFANEATSYRDFMLQLEGLGLHGSSEDYFRIKFGEVPFVLYEKPLMHLSGVADIKKELKFSIDFLQELIKDIEKL